VTGGDVSRFQRRSAGSPGVMQGGVQTNGATFSYTSGRRGPSSGPASALASEGPTVRVIRGKNITVEPVKGR
jgi:hypothetical protein